MPDNNVTFRTNLTFLGQTYNSNFATTGANNVDGSQPVGGIPAAKTGQLTTRTSASAGTLTMDPGHGFTTAAVVSLFWAGGSRVGVVVGTVSVNSVPFSGGSGDDLPANLTAVTAMVPTASVISVAGDTAVAAVAYTQQVPGDPDAYVQFTKSDDTVLATYKMTPANPAGFWNGTGTNPFAGQTVAKVKFSHGKLSALIMGGYVPYS